MFKIKRFTKEETRFHPKMGVLKTPITTIKKTFLGVPFKTLHQYRKTYHGAVKDCRDCNVAYV